MFIGDKFRIGKSYELRTMFLIINKNLYRSHSQLRSMQRSILFLVCLFSLVVSVSGYGLYVDCTDWVIVGTPIKCTIDSDYPAGTPIYLEFNSPSAQQVSSQQVTVMESKATQYKMFDTSGLPGGDYAIGVRLRDGQMLRNDSRLGNKVIITNSQILSTPTITTAPTREPVTVTTIPPSTQAPQLQSTSPTVTITTAATKSVQALLDEQNKKIEEQNRLIAEQNKKIDSQNDLLSQFLSRFKSIFGWN